MQICFFAQNTARGDVDGHQFGAFPIVRVWTGNVCDDLHTISTEHDTIDVSADLVSWQGARRGLRGACRKIEHENTSVCGRGDELLSISPKRAYAHRLVAGY